MIKAVLDTSVLISVFLNSMLPEGGLSRDIFQFAKADRFRLYTAGPILQEAHRVLSEEPRLRKKYSYTKEDVEEFLESLRSVSQFVEILPEISVVERDPEDNKILECALVAEARYLVTPDLDLLDLDSYRDVKIIKPEQFIHLLRESDSW